MNKNIPYLLTLFSVAAIVAGCSTTRRIPEGEILYTGVRRITVNTDSSGKLSQAIRSSAVDPLMVPPNNPLFPPYVRTPFPIGLWAYNAFYTEKTSGFRHWLFRTFAKEPVLVSKVQPELRVKLVEEILANYGYFTSRAGYELVRRSNPRKARISYSIDVSPPSVYNSIAFPRPTTIVTKKINALNPWSKLRVGDRYDIDTLAAERDRITGELREQGYFFFRSNFIRYLADTTRDIRKVDLRMIVDPRIPDVALHPYWVGSTTVRIENMRPRGVDTMILEGGNKVIYDTPRKIRRKVLNRAITFRPGDLFTLEKHNSTQSNLSKLGMFRAVNLTVNPLDSLVGRDSLDVFITASLDYPMEAELQVKATSKSSNFIGPGLTLSLRHNNLFKGGEILSLNLSGSYEWQTGSGHTGGGGKSSLINSYELGFSPALEIPRIWFPGFFDRNTRFPSRTRFVLGFELLNRPKFFRMLSLNGSLNYDFQTSPRSFHSLSLLRLTYNKLLNTTAKFDSTMAENPAIALSFENQLIPAMSYTYTYDNPFRRNRIVFQGSFTSAGNLADVGLGLFGQSSPKKLFGSRFSQFVKGTAEIKYYQNFDRRNQLVYRFMIGAGHAYGNSRVMPYTEQFYTGGANSIRAFTIRSLGPGSFFPVSQDRNRFLDQTGTFKLEANLEYRFGIIGKLLGAVFVDAGNVWLLRDDPKRPGGKLKWKHMFEEIALGTGVGLRYDLTFLIIRFDMGIGLHVPYDTNRRGYYNIPTFRDGLAFHLAIGYPF